MVLKILVKHLEELTSMTFYKEHLFLPYGVKKQKGTILFSLNTSYESLIDNIFNESDVPLSNVGGIYKSYYYDYTLLPNAIKSKRVTTRPITIAKAKKDRLSDYTLVKSRDESIKTVINPIPGGNNLIYDMEPVVRLYRYITKLNKISLLEKVTTFFNMINNLYNKVNINGYEKSIIMVNIDEYNKYKVPHTDLLYNISASLHRSEKFLSNLPKMNIKVLFYNTKGYFLMDLSKDLVKSNMGVLNRLLRRLNLDITKDMDTMEREEIQKAITKAATKGAVSNFVGVDDGIDSDGEIPDDAQPDTGDDTTGDNGTDNTGDEPIIPDPEADDNTDDTNTDDENGDNGNAKTDTDLGTDDNIDTNTDQADNVNTDEQMKKIEDEINKNLNDKQIDIRVKELKNKYIEVYNICNNINNRVQDINKTDENGSTIDFIISKINETKIIIYDYLSKTFNSKTYIENLTNYNQYLVVLSGIKKLLDEIIQKNDETKQ